MTTTTERIKPSGNPTTPPAENKPLPHRHARKCKICTPPHRESIDQDFRDSQKTSDLARRYQLDDSSLHRHLRALGLLTTRRDHLRLALDHIIERGVEKPVSGNDIIKAVRAHCCLTNDNRWVEPQKRVVYIHEQVPQPTAETPENSAHPFQGAPPPNRENTIRNQANSQKTND